MSLVRAWGVALVVPVTLTAVLPAQQPAAPAPAFDLSIDNIMRGPELYGRSPTQVRFSDDSRWVYFRWQRPGVDTAMVAYRVSVTGGEPEALSRAAEDTLYPEPGRWSRDRRFRVFVRNGDLWVYDASRGAARRLTDTRAAESNPQLSPDGRTAYFVREDNLWSLALESAALRQLTDVRRGAPPRGLTERDTTGQRGFLRAEQRRLFEFIRRPPREGPPFGARSDTTGPRPFYLSERQSIGRWEVSPDGRWLQVTLNERAANAHVQEMPVWVTASGYLETPDNRTKVGDEQNTRRVAFIELVTGRVTWFEPDQGRRALDVDGLGWSDDGRWALLRGFAKDFTDRWLWVAGPDSFRPRLVDLLSDSAWVGGLSMSAGWLPGTPTVWFTSERSGWAHVYVASAEGGEPRALSDAAGRFEVRGVSPSLDGRRFYYHANAAHFGEQHLYVVPAGGGAVQRLTTAEGRQDVEVSPDERWLAVLHSTANHPPELYLMPNRPGASWRQVTESPTEEWRRYAWRIPELVMVPARDGAEVPARLYRPARPNGAGVIFVHGAGYLQNAHRWWSSYSREYMFHHLLSERGYTVLDLDYRASAGLGRAWRTAIYRHMGGKDLDDQVDAARWMARSLGVDSARIGIYGGSYGGFITLMAMFTAPGVFAAGAALRPVTDWAHYNHGYTAAILNEPQDDSVAYRRSSPIYHAEGLRGALLIAHGMVDDNVNFQDAVRLVQRLIELRKEDWEIAIYPVEPHGFRMAASWADEYRRILRLFDRTLAASGGRRPLGGVY
jgi:dipeptidyl aminopeptidase/acylaminoacyl peptidase